MAPIRAGSKEPHGGMTPQQNDTLCRVERAAPMGALMRRYWLPACLSEDVAEPDGPPRRARLLGVNLVVFRDTAGRVGVLDELCPHRRASLVYGRNEDCGLRCLYHGWKFDVTGAATEMPSEPAGTALTEKIAARAYPVVESGGFVWVWLGDPDAVTPFDPPIWAKAAPGNVAVVKVHADCNWAQVLEGSIDSAHSSSLHSTNMPTADSVASSTATDTAWLRPSADKSPRLDVQRLDLGFRYAAIRTPIHDPDLRDYIRVTVFQAPFTVHIPPTDQYRLSQMLVPIDDENTMFYWIAWHTDPAKGIAQDDWRRFCGAEVGKDVEAVTYRKVRNAANGYLQDRAAMRAGDFTGIYGIPTQDMAMWESMGRIADRSEDRLGSSDKAIVTFRTMMLRAAEAAGAGAMVLADPAGLSARAELTSFEGMVDKSAEGVWARIDRTMGQN